MRPIPQRVTWQRLTVTLFGVAGAVAKRSVEYVLYALAGGVTLIPLVRSVRDVILDAKAGDIDSTVGFVRFRQEENGDFTGIVTSDRTRPAELNPPRGRWDGRRPTPSPGVTTFEISRARVEALQPHFCYRLFLFPRSRYLAGAEILGDERASPCP